MQQSIVSPLQHHAILSWQASGLIGNYPGRSDRAFPNQHQTPIEVVSEIAFSYCRESKSLGVHSLVWATINLHVGWLLIQVSSRTTASCRTRIKRAISITDVGPTCHPCAFSW